MLVELFGDVGTEMGTACCMTEEPARENFLADIGLTTHYMTHMFNHRTPHMMFLQSFSEENT